MTLHLGQAFVKEIGSFALCDSGTRGRLDIAGKGPTSLPAYACRTNAGGLGNSFNASVEALSEGRAGEMKRRSPEHGPLARRGAIGGAVGMTRA
ncbi:hypothetical protein ACFWZ3_12325 [Frateuria sp. GZRR35]|uniref:hypothetical protein n=1 Tax=Frateuria sp. TaxID=2211372 RepID=UPI003EDB7AE5